MTHCDVGLSPQLAHVLGEKPTIEHLCGIYDSGGNIRDNLGCIELWGKLPAAVNCPFCIRVAEMIHRGNPLERARRLVGHLL